MIKKSEVKKEVENVEIPQNNEEPQLFHVNYERAILSKRISASIIDFLIFAILVISLFLLTRNIVTNNVNYKNVQESYDTLKLESGLYIKSTQKNSIYNLYDYYELSTSTSKGAERIFLKDGIEQFITYSEQNSDTHAIDVGHEWDEFRRTLVVNGKQYFDYVDGEYVEISGIGLDNYCKYAYGVFLKENCCGAYLVQNFSLALKATRLASDMLLFVELPISVVVSTFVTFLVPTLIFKRGRKTIGKLAMKCAIVNKNYLNLTTGENWLRFGFIFLVEIIASCFTFAIPLLISAIFLTFSPKHQPLHDIIFKFDCIDTTTDKVYFSKEEIIVEKTKEPEHIEFTHL